MTKNTDYLQQHGPVAPTELPVRGVSSIDKMSGLWKFKVSTGTVSRVGGSLTPVYYLRDIHPPELVVQRWLEVNERAVEMTPRHGLRMILRRTGSEFHDAIDDLLPMDDSMKGRDRVASDGQNNQRIQQIMSKVEPQTAVGIEEYRVPTPDELRELRRDLGVTQSQLASAIGSQQTTISQFEVGNTDMMSSTLRKAVDYLREVGDVDER